MTSEEAYYWREKMKMDQAIMEAKMETAKKRKNRFRLMISDYSNLDGYNSFNTLPDSYFVATRRASHSQPVDPWATKTFMELQEELQKQKDPNAFDPDKHDIYFNGEQLIYILDDNVIPRNTKERVLRIGCITEDWGYGKAILPEDLERDYFIIQTATKKIKKWKASSR